jgi:outer membrane protein assembly factor BamD
MKLRYLTLVLLAGTLFTSCSMEYDKLLNNPVLQDRYEGAFKYFKAKKYTKSAELFESILLAVKNTEQEDTVQYYLGMSNYLLGDYTTAEANFDSFGQVFPRSPFSEDAKFYRIKCLYWGTHRYELDQTPSYKTLAVINEFLYEFPNSTHLAECKDIMKDLQTRIDQKSFENARLYYKIEDYQAAAYALKIALKDNPDNYFREEIMFYVVASNYKYALNSYPSKQKERFLVVIDEYYNFISEFPQSLHRNEVDKMFKKAQEVTNIK